MRLRDTKRMVASSVKYAKKTVAALFVTFVAVGAPASAALAAPTYSLTDIEAIGGAMLTAVAAIWLIRQAINLAR